MRLPGYFGNETYGETGVGVSAAESVNDKQTLARKLMGDEPFQMLPGFRGERFVVVLTFTFVGPPERVARGVVTDNVLILWRTSGKDTRINGNGAQIR